VVLAVAVIPLTLEMALLELSTQVVVVVVLKITLPEMAVRELLSFLIHLLTQLLLVLD
jgi:hypothetical protein